MDTKQPAESPWLGVVAFVCVMAAIDIATDEVRYRYAPDDFIEETVGFFVLAREVVVADESYVVWTGAERVDYYAARIRETLRGICPALRDAGANLRCK